MRRAAQALPRPAGGRCPTGLRTNAGRNRSRRPLSERRRPGSRRGPARAGAPEPGLQSRFTLSAGRAQRRAGHGRVLRRLQCAKLLRRPVGDQERHLDLDRDGPRPARAGEPRPDGGRDPGPRRAGAAGGRALRLAPRSPDHEVGPALARAQLHHPGLRTVGERAGSPALDPREASGGRPGGALELQHGRQPRAVGDPGRGRRPERARFRAGPPVRRARRADRRLAGGSSRLQLRRSRHRPHRKDPGQARPTVPGRRRLPGPAGRLQRLGSRGHSAARLHRRRDP